LSFENSTLCVFADGRPVLNGVSGIAQPGTVTAILGSSGAGKTTFIDILAGRKNTGEITGMR
jgi:ABC-type multidrug transport system ATPase subunit